MFDLLHRYQRCQGAAIALILMSVFLYNFQAKPNGAIANQLQKASLCPPAPFHPLAILKAKNAKSSK
jgi:hypothetical protein